MKKLHSWRRIGFWANNLWIEGAREFHPDGEGIFLPHSVTNSTGGLKETTVSIPAATVSDFLFQMLRPKIFRFSSENLLYLHYRSLTNTSGSRFTPPGIGPQGPVNPAHLLKICTILYQQQHASDSKLHGNLSKTEFALTHEFFIQVCEKFPYSWRPVYRFHLFLISQFSFAHTSVTFNKMLDAVGKSRNIDLFWDLCSEIGDHRSVNIKTWIIALRTLASAKELKKCVEFFHLMNGFGYEYEVGTLNKVTDHLCRNKLVVEAKHLVFKLNDFIKPDRVTYRCLVYGFCDVGDLIEASKVWNLMVEEEGSFPDVLAAEVMIETLFKHNKFDDAIQLFQSMRAENLPLSTYRQMIKWFCNKGQMGEAYTVFQELQMRGMKPDHQIAGYIIYGLLRRGRVNEAYDVFHQVENADISVYHGMIKGLLRLKKPGEATEIFREMIRRGCEPIMHTYVMLLQGHLGKRGRRGEDPLVNFDTIFVGGLIKARRLLEATKYVERVMDRGTEVPRFDYNKFLHFFSNEEGVAMFAAMDEKLREVGLFDLADIFDRYGRKMATRDRRRRSEKSSLVSCHVE
ncbi:hypothetical protein M569_02544 [Genlisea aurea]|uniref:Pentacotripeptide-repeat region of PRORP domain-containing protein n=1 Tax=Genlisea aurea TaxID=192259 RepID=S8EHN4_9LAMI|nr:hypothetical protein M569_02544 [Genlisea aurea]